MQKSNIYVAKNAENEPQENQKLQVIYYEGNQ